MSPTIILRLLGAAMYLSLAAAAAETQKLRRDIDPESIVHDSLDDLIAEYAELHETLRQDYIAEGCEELWGEFPSPTSTSFHHPSKEALKRRGKNGMLCNCGMYYDLAISTMLLKDEDSHPDTAFAAVEDFTGIDYGARQHSNNNKPMTQLESWSLARTAHSETKCVGGTAAGYPCRNVDLIAHIPLTNFRTTNTKVAPLEGNDVWGWTSNDGREFVIFGVREGMYFFEAKSDSLVLLGFMEENDTEYELHHDVKVIGDYAYIGAESDGQGMQIFDMRRLLNVRPNTDCVSVMYCQELQPDRIYTGTGSVRLGNSHNIVVNERTKYVYVVGSKSCAGGLHIVDVIDPLNPRLARCYKGGGYTHDAQCVVYEGPDTRYRNREICFCYNEDTVDIVDVTIKNSIQRLSSTAYRDVGYTHQGWLSTDQKYVVFGDETDEVSGDVSRTRTLVLNVENLENPNPNSVREFYGSTPAVDHNQYIINGRAKGHDYATDSDLIFQANYEAGMRILQVVDYETANFREVGYFDTYPFSNRANFNGAWSVFPFFESGLVVISTITEGFFLVRPKLHSELEISNVNMEFRDEEVAYKGKSRKNCSWVGKARPGKPKMSRLRTRRRCKKKHTNGVMLHNWCKKTCGEVGIGQFKAMDTKFK